MYAVSEQEQEQERKYKEAGEGKIAAKLKVVVRGNEGGMTGRKKEEKICIKRKVRGLCTRWVCGVDC